MIELTNLLSLQVTATFWLLLYQEWLCSLVAQIFHSIPLNTAVVVIGYDSFRYPRSQARFYLLCSPALVLVFQEFPRLLSLQDCWSSSPSLLYQLFWKGLHQDHFLILFSGEQCSNIACLLCFQELSLFHWCLPVLRKKYLVLENTQNFLKFWKSHTSSHSLRYFSLKIVHPCLENRQFKWFLLLFFLYSSSILWLLGK